ncbi:MAG: DUF5677 domain-containing protein [Thiobacillus sp.]|nr:DUF5677 domain-containing protein [Thiobacillus sp.]
MDSTKSDETPKKELGLEVLEAFLIYEQHSKQYLAMLPDILNGEFKSLQPVVRLLMHQMTDRIVYGVQHCNAISSVATSHCEIDLATINRSIYETIVTLIFILKKNSESRFLSYCINSIESDLRRIRQVQNWEKHPDLEISISANAWLGNERTTEEDRKDICKSFNVHPSQVQKLPDVLNRAKDAGDVWAYFYDTRYRETSGWSHGHISRIWTSASYHRQDDKAPGKAINLALVMTSWTVEMLFRLIESFSEISQNPEYAKRAEKIRTAMYEKITPILDRHGFVSSIELPDIQT